MPHHLESNDSANQAGPQLLSPDRPPQWKWMNCGYRCGWGCEKPDDDEAHGGESDNGSETTRVGTNDGDVMGAMESEEVDSGEAYRQASLFGPENFDDGEPRVIVVVNGSSSSHLSQTETDWESGSAVAHPTQEYSDMSDSLDPEPCATGDQSVMSSSGISARARSPDPGFAYWTRGFPVAPPSRQYFFRDMPLRLSPQCEHCRGHPACHMMLHDDLLSLTVMTDRWRRQIPGDGYAF